MINLNFSTICEIENLFLGALCWNCCVLLKVSRSEFIFEIKFRRKNWLAFKKKISSSANEFNVAYSGGLPRDRRFGKFCQFCICRSCGVRGQKAKKFNLSNMNLDMEIVLNGKQTSFERSVNILVFLEKVRKLRSR